MKPLLVFFCYLVLVVSTALVVRADVAKPKPSPGRDSIWRDFAVIVIANLASFGFGEILNAWGWFGIV